MNKTGLLGDPLSGERMDTNGSRWLCVDIPLMDYKEALDLQRSLVDAKTSEIMGRDLILFLEHPPVFTLGLRGGGPSGFVQGVIQKADKELIAGCLKVAIEK